jgi:WD40 repeat protein
VDNKRGELRRLENKLEKEGARFRQVRYAGGIRLARLYFDEGDLPAMRSELEEILPSQGQEDLRGFEWYYLHRRLQQGRILTRQPAPVECVAFPPDGKCLAMGSEDSTIRIWAMPPARKSVLTFDKHTSVVRRLAFRRDGRRVISVSENEFWVWDAINGKDLYRPARFRGAGLSCMPVVSFGPDGRGYAAWGEGTKVFILDIQDDKEVFIHDRHAAPITALAFDGTGQMIVSAAGAADHPAEVKVWEALTGKERPGPKNIPGTVVRLVISADGKRLAMATHEGGVIVWDLATGQEVTRIEKNGGRIASMAFNGDGQRLAVGMARAIGVHELPTGQEVLTFRSEKGHINDLAFSPAGRQLVSAGQDGTVRSWDLSIHEDGSALSGPSARLRGIVFSRDGGRVISWSQEGEATALNVWRSSQGQTHLPLANYQLLSLRNVAISLDGKRVASGLVTPSSKKVPPWFPLVMRVLPRSVWKAAGVKHEMESKSELKVWDASSGRELYTIAKGNGFLYQPTFSPDGRRIIVANMPAWQIDTEVMVRDAATGRKLNRLKGMRGLLYAIRYSADGKRLATVAFPLEKPAALVEKYVQLMIRNAGGKKGGGLAKEQNEALSREAKAVLSNLQSDVKLWDPTTGQERGGLRGPRGIIFEVAYSADHARLATASFSGQAIWSLVGMVLSLPKPTQPMLDELGKSIHVRVTIWDTITGRPVWVLKPHPMLPYRLQFSPDGRVLAMAGLRADRMVRAVQKREASGPREVEYQIWNVQTGRQLHGLHAPTITSRNDAAEQNLFSNELDPDLVFSSDGKYLFATGSGPVARTLQGWEMETGRELAFLRKLSPVAVSRNGRRIVSGGANNTVQIWDTDSGQRLLTLRGHKDKIIALALSPSGLRLVSVDAKGRARIWDATPP